MIERALIEQIVKEVLKNLNINSVSSRTELKPCLLIVKGQKDLDSTLLTKLNSKWNVFYKDFEERELPETVDAVIFLDASKDLYVKGAIGITDTPESSLLAHYILEGVPVSLIASPSLESIILENERKVVNGAYLSHLLKYKETLKTFGVKVESIFSFIQASSSKENGQSDGTLLFQKKLLTQTDVQTCKEKKIAIDKKTIVTPLALDTARELGKGICVIDSKGADVSWK